MAQQEGLRKYWKLNLCLWLILPLRGCEMELAWGFQSKGEVALLVHLGKGFMEREFLSVLHNTHNAQGSLDPLLCVFVEALSSPHPEPRLVSSIRLSTSPH